MENSIKIDVKGKLPKNCTETDIIFYIFSVIKGTRAKELHVEFPFHFDTNVILKEMLYKYYNMELNEEISNPDITIELNIDNLYPLMMHLPSTEIMAVEEIKNMPVNTIIHDNNIEDMPQKAKLIRIGNIREIPIKINLDINLPMHYNIISTLPVIVPGRSVYYMNPIISLKSILNGKITL